MRLPSAVIQKHREIFGKNRLEPVIDLDLYAQASYPFYIARLEDLSVPLEGVFPLRRQSQHYFELIRKGSGNKTVGCRQFPVSGDMLIVVPAHIMHSGCYSPDTEGFLLAFDRDFFPDRAFPGYLVENKGVLSHAEPFLLLTAPQAGHLSSILESLLDEVIKGHAETSLDEIVPVKILEFLIFGHRYSNGAGNTRVDSGHNRLVHAFNDLIDKHWVQHRSVAFYAAALHLHPNRLNTLIRSHCGRSPKAVINRRITEEAKYLLANTLLAIHDVAHRLGFDDPNYFSYFFKRETGISPHQFKSVKIEDRLKTTNKQKQSKR